MCRTVLLPFYIIFCILTLIIFIIIVSLRVEVFFFFRTFPFSVLLSIVHIYLNYFIVSCYLFIYLYMDSFIYFLSLY